MQDIKIKIPQKIIERFGDKSRKIVEKMLETHAEKLKIVDEIKKMNLPVAEWDEIEEEIIKGAISE